MPHLLNLPIKGQCQCGQAQFTVSQMPLTYYACHCTECQKQSASAFGLSLWARKSAFEVTGKTRTWTRDTDSGNKLHCFFCPDCGTRLYHEGDKPSPAFGAIVSIKGGAVPALRTIEPIGHIWTKSKLLSTIIPDGVLSFPDGSFEISQLLKAWQDFLAKF